MAASRLLGAVAACVILLSFAAEDRKSYWNGCIKAAKVNCQQIFSILALIIFLLKFLLKSASKSSFRRFGQVMFLDNNIATASHKARAHGPGWRTAHASSFVVVLGSDS